MKGLLTLSLAFIGALSSIAQAQDAPEVQVETLQSQLKRQWVSTSGRLSAVEVVDIRPQVGGRIDKILFSEGSEVKQGDLLLVIDPRPYQAEVDRAEAKLASAKAQASLAAAELKRAGELLGNKVISQSQYDLRNSEDSIARADIEAAKAELEDAELQLDYAHIRAPIDGRIGRAEITRGNVISAGGNAPLLTRVVGSQAVYAEFELSERDYLSLRKQQISSGAEVSAMPVQLSLNGSAGETYLGNLHAFDNRIDSRTGTIRARALFNNDDGLLLPGIFAELRVGSAITEPVILVNQRAINTDQNKKFVYTVSAENKVVYRQVQLGNVVDGYRRVLTGLEAGDRVIVNGLQKLRPEMPVSPVEKNAPRAVSKAPAVAAKADLVSVAVEY